MAAEEILTKAWKLARTMKYKQVWVKEDMNREEKAAENELRREANEKNKARTETEKKRLYWRVLDMRLRKWYKKEDLVQETWL